MTQLRGAVVLITGAAGGFGQKLPDTHLMDPHAILCQMHTTLLLYPLIAHQARRIAARLPRIDNVLLPAPNQDRLAQPLKVF